MIEWTDESIKHYESLRETADPSVIAKLDQGLVRLSMRLDLILIAGKDVAAGPYDFALTWLDPETREPYMWGGLNYSQHTGSWSVNT